MFISKLKHLVENDQQFVIGGDFNDNGKIFSDFNDLDISPWDEFADLNGVVLLNDGSITRPESGRALDATFARNFSSHEWRVLNEGFYSSDHSPIWFKLSGIKHTRYKQTKRKRMKKFTLVDWKSITKKLKQDLSRREKDIKGERTILWWCNQITRHILENSSDSRKTFCPWWTDELKKLKSIRSKMRRLKKYEEYKRAHREFRRVFQREKRKYHRENLFKIANDRNPYDGLYKLLPGLRKKKNKGGISKYDSFQTAMKRESNFVISVHKLMIPETCTT